MISVYVVEDEVRILKSTLLMLEDLQLKIAGSATTIEQAYKGILSSKPDLLLLDVEIGSSTSFELLERFPEVNFRVIFITAHQKYALDAFKFSAVDFLLKPLRFNLLKESINKVGGLLDTGHKALLDTLQHNLQASQKEQKIILKTQDKIWILELSEIIFCQSDLSYTTFHTSQEKIVVSKTMGYYEELLSNYGFFRVHKSHLINVSHVRKIHRTDGSEAEMTGGHRIPISQRKKEKFLGLIDTQGLI